MEYDMEDMVMEYDMEDMVMKDIMKWKSQKGVSFMNVKDMIEAYWKEYLDGQRSIGNEDTECIG
jgi:hypothetical protein